MYTHLKFKNKKACVLGMGKSGISCARLLKRQGVKVLLSEENVLPVATGLEGIDVEVGGHSQAVYESDFVVKSPGISHSHPVIKKLKKLGKPVFSEVEIAMAYTPKDCQVFAITGTNGKTTTTMMLSEIMKAHAKEEGLGRKVYTVGNIGKPFSSVADKIEAGSIIVIEVSSYQLEDSSYFRPFSSSILNITPDHLEHHGGLKKYIEAKAKIFADQTARQSLIINGSDKHCLKLIERAKCKVFSFSSTPHHQVRIDVFYDGDEMIFADGYRIKPPKLLIGIHNVENAMAASLMAFAAGVSQSAVQEGFDTFNCVEHRIEYFADYKGIKCYNDSKATNVDSTVTALKALQSANRIWLILGGRDKGAPYKPLLPFLNNFCKHAVLIGEASPIIKQALSGRFPATEKGDLKSAVEFILSSAQEGDIMLLSPACASFDQFKDFEDRGKQFKQMVADYIKAHK